MVWMLSLASENDDGNVVRDEGSAEVEVGWIARERKVQWDNREENGEIQHELCCSLKVGEP